MGLFLIILQCRQSYLQIKTRRTISTNKKTSMKTKGPVVCTEHCRFIEHCRTQFIKYLALLRKIFYEISTRKYITRIILLQYVHFKVALYVTKII